MKRKPKTRRHLAYAVQKGGFLGRETRLVLVNTGKAYNKPARRWWEGLRALGSSATASTLDIRGHGRGTSRCKRVQRANLANLGAALAAYPVPREQGKSWFGRIAEAMALPPRMMNPLA